MADQTGKACLLLHGFTGGPYEVQPLAQALESAGWYCRVPVLPGHDPSLQNLKGATCEDWLQAACTEAEQMVDQYGSFDLVGFSMGGMLAVHLAARYPVKRLALLGAAAIYVSPGRLVRDWIDNRSVKNGAARHKLKQTPVSAALEFMRLVHRVRGDLGRVASPALVVQGLRDPIVHPVSARYISKRLQVETRTVYFPKSKHLLCLDEEAEQVIGTVMDFLA
jgi:carboxylesterase